ncbi:MAG TPA: hypothetical protein VMU31_12035, partial [Rhizomicrobium sp.]|nr:hypothetical protein [Rhizomicrobium sp.]
SWRLAVFTFLAFIPCAFADPEGPAPAPQPQPSLDGPPPKSVWDIDMDGSATHLQSGMLCPRASGDFARVAVRMYDKVGFDVSCGYNSKTAALTFYLTRRDPASLEADFEGEKKAVTEKTPSAAANDGALSFTTDLAWKSAGFNESGGALRSDLWLASLSGWEFQIRATYRANETAPVATALAELSAGIEKSAGAHLAACAASPPPQRGGAQKVMDDAALLKLALSGAMGAVVAGNNPANWCADSAFQVGPTPFMLWHNIGAAGKVSFADRITPVLGGTPIFVMADQAGNEMLAKSAPGSTSDIYDVVVDRGDTFALAGIFNGHPLPRDFANLMVVGGAYGIFSTAGKTDKKISIFRAPPQPH